MNNIQVYKIYPHKNHICINHYYPNKVLESHKAVINNTEVQSK